MNWMVYSLVKGVTNPKFGAMYEKERSPALLWVFGITREVRLEDRRW